MLDHVSITVSDFAAAERFYDAIMKALNKDGTHGHNASGLPGWKIRNLSPGQPAPGLVRGLLEGPLRQPESSRARQV